MSAVSEAVVAAPSTPPTVPSAPHRPSDACNALSNTLGCNTYDDAVANTLDGNFTCASTYRSPASSQPRPTHSRPWCASPYTRPIALNAA